MAGLNPLGGTRPASGWSGWGLSLPVGAPISTRGGCPRVCAGPYQDTWRRAGVDGWDVLRGVTPALGADQDGQPGRVASPEVREPCERAGLGVRRVVSRSRQRRAARRRRRSRWRSRAGGVPAASPGRENEDSTAGAVGGEVTGAGALTPAFTLGICVTPASPQRNPPTR